MNYATTTCGYYAPVDYTGAAPVASSTPFAFASSTCNIEYSTSTAQSVYFGFTYGELVISVFAFLIFVVVAYTALFNWVVGIKIKK